MSTYMGMHPATRPFGVMILTVLLGGCSSNLCAAVVPLVDSRGGVGMEASIGANIGMTAGHKNPDQFRRTGMITLGAEAGGGIVAKGAAHPLFLVGGGIDYVEVARTPGDVGFRVGASGGGWFAQSQPAFARASFRGGVFVTAWRGPGSEGLLEYSTPFVSIGPVGQFNGLFAKVGSTDLSFAQAGVGVGVDWYHLSHWTVAM